MAPIAQPLIDPLKGISCHSWNADVRRSYLLCCGVGGSGRLASCGAGWHVVSKMEAEQIMRDLAV